MCCTPWGHKESDMNEQLNNKDFADVIKDLQMGALSSIIPVDPKYNEKCPYKKEAGLTA